jgi:hypothetical protein
MRKTLFALSAALPLAFSTVARAEGPTTAAPADSPKAKGHKVAAAKAETAPEVAKPAAAAEPVKAESAKEPAKAEPKAHHKAPAKVEATKAPAKVEAAKAEPAKAETSPAAKP